VGFEIYVLGQVLGVGVIFGVTEADPENGFFEGEKLLEGLRSRPGGGFHGPYLISH